MTKRLISFNGKSTVSKKVSSTKLSIRVRPVHRLIRNILNTRTQCRSYAIGKRPT